MALSTALQVLRGESDGGELIIASYTFIRNLELELQSQQRYLGNQMVNGNLVFKGVSMVMAQIPNDFIIIGKRYVYCSDQNTLLIKLTSSNQDTYIITNPRTPLPTPNPIIKSTRRKLLFK